MLGFALVAGQPGAVALPIAIIAIGYAAYLAFWAVLILLVSALVGRSRDALLGLLALWAVVVVLLPRLAPDIASAAYPLTNRLQTDIAVARDLRTMGDSHNPDDPYFAQFKQSVLDRYGVSRVEDLPVNYKGLLGMEGERMTSELFDRYSTQSYDAQERQNGVVQAIGALSPAIALRTLSMAAAGTDFAGHRRFLEQAETYRYDLVQRLNRLQADAVSYADDTAEDPDADRRKRVTAANWQKMPDFSFRQPGGATLATAALPGLAVLLAWLAFASLLLGFVTRRLGAR
jgi:ABC-2 type transport system permease protein